MIFQRLSLLTLEAQVRGGQNVNKVNSKAVLRWSLEQSACLTDAIRLRLSSQLKNRLNKSGELILTSEKYRDQIRNKEDCLLKFQEILKRALSKPKPRKKTKPSKASQLKARNKRKSHSEKKQLRKKPRLD